MEVCKGRKHHYTAACKECLLYKKKTIERKIKEVFLTYQIEKILTKERILELYLNEVEWG